MNKLISIDSVLDSRYTRFKSLIFEVFINRFFNVDVYVIQKKVIVGLSDARIITYLTLRAWRTKNPIE